HFAVSFYLVDAIAANVRIAGPDNSSGFGDGAITTESQNDHGSSESGFSGRLAFSPIGTQALQELLGSKLLVLSQRTSGISLIKSITMPNISGPRLNSSSEQGGAVISGANTSPRHSMSTTDPFIRCLLSESSAQGNRRGQFTYGSSSIGCATTCDLTKPAPIEAARAL